MANRRYFGLDYLRGIAAFFVMIYHYFLFQSYSFNNSDFLMKTGVYAVSIFYILSGLTMYLVYRKNNFLNMDINISFIRKRVFRILPLFIVATVFVFVFKGSSLLRLFLNITGLFSIFGYDKYIVTGGWSIGNELFFYMFFPIVMILLSKNRVWYFLFLILSFLAMVYYTFYVINPDFSLKDNWKFYINPINQAFLFFIGTFIGYFLYNKRISNLFSILCIFGGVFVYYFYNVDGGASNLFYGFNRLIFIAIIIIIIGFFKLEKSILIFHKPLTILGEISYGVYLLHPIVYMILNKFIVDIDLIFSLFYFTGTFVLSYLSYNYFEKFFIKLA